MTRKGSRQVSPKMAAGVILIVLTAIQVLWWRGLITPPQAGPGGGPRGGPAPDPGPPLVFGRTDVRVETVSGGPEPGRADGPGHAARFAAPTGLTLGPDGALYVADTLNHAVRRVETEGKTSTLAGGLPGYADGPAAQARFNLPCGVAVGPDGAVYVADTGNHRIRRIKDNQVTTLAGGEPGTASGAGAQARFRSPVALAYVSGSLPCLYVADAGNRKVQCISLSGQNMGVWDATGSPVGVYAGKQTAFAIVGTGLAFPDRTLYTGMELWRDTPIDMQSNSGNTADYTLHNPVALCPAPGGWFAAASRHAAILYVRKGRAEVIAGRVRGSVLASGWWDEDGRECRFGEIGGLVSDGRGHLFVSDTGNNCIRRVSLPPDLGGGTDAGKESLR